MIKNKNNFLKSIIIAGIIAVVLIIFSIVVYLYPYIILFSEISPHNVDKSQLVLQFNKYKKEFQNTADYLRENKYNTFIEKKSWGKYSVENVSPNGNEQFKITDSKVTTDIKGILNSLGYEIIDEKDNDIYFIRSRGLGYVQAIVYTKDGNTPQPYRPKVIEKISDNWYYCESED